MPLLSLDARVLASVASDDADGSVVFHAPPLVVLPARPPRVAWDWATTTAIATASTTKSLLWREDYRL